MISNKIAKIIQLFTNNFEAAIKKLIENFNKYSFFSYFLRRTLKCMSDRIFEKDMQICISLDLLEKCTMQISEITEQ